MGRVQNSTINIHIHQRWWRAAAERGGDGPVPRDPHPRPLLHDEPAHDEGRVAAREAEEELCEPRDYSSCGC